MPHYFLDLYNRVGPVPDKEGQELANIEAARSRAIESIREMVSEDALIGVLHLRGRIEILDGQRELVAVVQFLDAFELTVGDRTDA